MGRELGQIGCAYFLESVETVKKHIVHLTFNMGMGGAEQVIYNLVEHTDKTRYIVSILCLEEPVGAFGKQLIEKGIQIVSFRRKPGFDWSVVRDIRHFLKHHDVAVLHCHQYTPYVYGLSAAVFMSTKVIFTEHGRFFPDVRRPKRVLLNPLLNCFTAYITAISSATKDALIQYENFPAKKIKVIYNGLDDTRYLLPPETDFKKELGLPESARMLGTVGRLDPIKNQKMMIKALRHIRASYPETVLVIIGDGPERHHLESFVSELELSSHVIFTGFREDVHRYFSVMDLFLLTSFSEGTAMTILEAMASSLPMVVTDVGGNPEIVQEGETGFVVPSDDEKSLVDRILYLFENPDMMNKMGQAGRARFDEYFTVDKMVHAYEEMYEGSA